MSQKGFAPVVLILAIFLLSAGVVGSAFAIKKYKPELISQYNNIKQEPQASVTPTTQPTISQDETNNWKIYSNTKYSYQVKYPTGEIGFDKDITNRRDLIHSTGIYIDTTVGESKQTIILSIDIWKDLGIKITDTNSREKWCNLIENQLAKEEWAPIGCIVDHDDKFIFTETVIGGIKALKTTGGRDNSEKSILYVPYKEYIYQIEITTGTGEIDLPISNQILSTFKFTN